MQEGRTVETIYKTGLIVFVMLYCGKDSDSLTNMRYLKYTKMASSSRFITSDSLPPTSSVKHTNWKCPGTKIMELEVRWCLFGASYDGWRTYTRWAAQDKMMQLSSDIKNSLLWKKCSCLSNRPKCVAACRGCWGT